MGADWSVVIGIVLLAAVALVVLLYVVWQALLLRYQEEPDAHELHNVTTKDGWDLKLFRYRNPDSNGDPVLLCHGAFANHTNFTKPRGSCLVDTLLDHGCDCWLIDFRGTRSSEPALGRKRTRVAMDDYLNYDVPAALAFIRQVTGRSQVHWIGHSLGGMLLYAHVLAHGNGTVATGTTLGSPIGFQGARIGRHKLILAFIRQFPQLVGIIMRVGARLACAIHPRSAVFPVNWRNLHPKVRGRDFFNMIETPPPQMASELARWATTKSWRMNNGELDVVANFHRLNIPLFAIYGAADPFVPVDEAIAFVEGLPHPDKQIMILSKEDGFVENYNHVDLAFGKEGPEEVYEPIAAWIHAHPMTDDVRHGDDREGRAFMARRVQVGRAEPAAAEEAPADRAEIAARIAEVEPVEAIAAPPAAARKVSHKVTRPKPARIIKSGAAKSAKTKKASVKKKPRASASRGPAKAASKKKKTTAARTSLNKTASKKPGLKNSASRKAVSKKKSDATKPASTKSASNKRSTPKKKVTAKRRRS